MFWIGALDGLACSLLMVALILTIVLRATGLHVAGSIVAWAGVVVGTLPCCTGLGSSFAAKDRVDEILPLVDPEQREELRRVGYAEAEHPMYFGLGSGLVFALCASVPLAIALTARRPAPAPEEPGY